jgi:hypothetical protein
VIISRAHLRTVLARYALCCNTARPDGGPGRPVVTVVGPDTARIRRGPVLGGEDRTAA